MTSDENFLRLVHRNDSGKTCRPKSVPAARIRDAYGPDAVAVYIGNPTAFNVGLSIYAAGFLAALGTRNFFNASSLDCQNKFAVAQEMFGGYVVQPIPENPANNNGMF